MVAIVETITMESDARKDLAPGLDRWRQAVRAQIDLVSWAARAHELGREAAAEAKAELSREMIFGDILRGARTNWLETADGEINMLAASIARQRAAFAPAVA